MAMQCPNCGKEYHPGDNFCSHCGTRLLEIDKGAEATITVNGLIEQYLKAISTKPNDASAHNNLGLAYMYKRLYDLAIMEFEKVKHLEPDFPDVHYHLGSLYLKQGIRQKAIEEFEQALKFEPDQLRLRKILDRLKGEAGKK